MIIAEQEHIALMFLTEQEAVGNGIDLEHSSLDHEKINSIVHLFVQNVSQHGDYEYCIDPIAENDIELLDSIIHECPETLRQNIPDASMHTVKIGVRDIGWNSNNLNGQCQIRIVCPKLDNSKRADDPFCALPSPADDEVVEIPETIGFEFSSYENMISFIIHMNISPKIYKIKDKYVLCLQTDEHTTKFNLVSLGFASLEYMGHSISQAELQFAIEHGDPA